MVTSPLAIGLSRLISDLKLESLPTSIEWLLAEVEKPFERWVTASLRSKWISALDIVSTLERMGKPSFCFSLEETKKLRVRISKPQRATGDNMYRSNSYDEKLSRKLKNPVFAQEYLLALVDDEEEPMSIEDALRHAILKMGTTDFAELVEDDKGNVDKF